MDANLSGGELFARGVAYTDGRLSSTGGGVVTLFGNVGKRGLGAASDLPITLVSDAQRQAVFAALQNLAATVRPLQDAISGNLSSDQQYKLDNANQLLYSLAGVVADLYNTGQISNQPAGPQDVANVYRLMGKTAQEFADLADYAQTTTLSAQAKAIAAGTATSLVQDIGQFGNAANSLTAGVESLATGVGSAVQTTGSWLAYLPWLIAGVIVVPVVIRVATAEGGAKGKARALASEIDSGRRRAGEYVRKGVTRFA